LRLVRRGRRTATVTTPKEAASFLRGIRHLDREAVWRLDLDARNRVVGYELVSLGTVTASLIHPREVFKGAFLTNAVAIIIAHNHPSGDPTPSFEDREVTKRLKRAGEILGVPLTDHLVVGRKEVYSFRDHGLL
jgi:DNA repair protein RadC